MHRIAFAALALLVLNAATGAAQTPADSAGIRQAALDYIEGYFEGDAARMERALHPELVKRIIRTDSLGRSAVMTMGASQLIAGTRMGGGRDTPPDQKRTDVSILDIFRNAASARIDAGQWIDYLQLAKADGRWVIVNVLWETRPPGADR